MRNKPKQMPKAQRDRLKVGDWIKVRTWDRYGYHTIVRKIVYRGEMGIGIRFNGCNPFYLYSKHDIIIEKISRDILALKARASGIRSYTRHIKMTQR